MIQKLFLRVFTFFHVALYHLTNGRLGGRMNGLPVLLLHTIGCKTGKSRITPLGYFEHEGGYVVTGSNAGMNSHPGWYYNLTSNQRAKVRVEGDLLPISVNIVESGQYDQLWEKLTGLAPSYNSYSRKANRKIPIMILHANVKG